MLGRTHGETVWLDDLRIFVLKVLRVLTTLGLSRPESLLCSIRRPTCSIHSILLTCSPHDANQYILGEQGKHNVL